MKPMTRRITVIASGIVLIGALGACGHRAYHASPEKHAAHLVEHIGEDLDLNAAQSASLNSLKNELLALRERMHQEHKATHTALLDMLSQSTLDRDRAVALIQTRLQALQDQAPHVVAAVGDFYDGLTPQQQQTLREKIEKRMDHSHGHGHGH